jgi:tRNA(fMet)-specific endonuclease VapC
MKYLLDTNVCIRYLTGRSIPVKNRIESINDSSLFLCSVVRGELEYGARKSNNPDRSLQTLKGFLSYFPDLPFDSAAAEQYGIIRALLEKQGTPIGPYDMQIAAIAISTGATLVTHNTKEFGRINGLSIIDWEQ